MGYSWAAGSAKPVVEGAMEQVFQDYDYARRAGKYNLSYTVVSVAMISLVSGMAVMKAGDDVAS